MPVDGHDLLEAPGRAAARPGGPRSCRWRTRHLPRRRRRARPAARPPPARDRPGRRGRPRRRCVAGSAAPRSTHERFGTATSVRRLRVDLARARARALPAARRAARRPPGRLDEDLARRDVTVNAIAVGLDGGAVHASPGRSRTSRRGVLRVLHDALVRRRPDAAVARRALRRAAGLRGRAADARSSPAAADRGALSAATGSDGNELRLALREPDPPAALRERAALSPGLLPDGVRPRPRGLDDGAGAAAAGRGAPRPRDARRLRARAWTRARCWPGWTTWASPAPRPRLVAAASRCVTGAPLRAATHPGGDRPGGARRAARGRRARGRRQRAALDRRAAPRAARDHRRRPPRRRRAAGPGGRRAPAPRAGPQARRRGPPGATPSCAARAANRFAARDGERSTPCSWDGGPATTRSSTSRSPTRRAGSASGSATRCSRRSTAPAECSLWFMAMAPDGDALRRRKRRFPVERARRATPTRSG